MRFTKKEKEQLFDVLDYYHDKMMQFKTDRASDEIEIIHGMFLKVRKEVKGF